MPGDTIGQPTDDRMPSARASSAIGPVAPAKLVHPHRTARLLHLRGDAQALESEPRADGQPPLASLLQTPTPVTVPSAS